MVPFAFRSNTQTSVHSSTQTDLNFCFYSLNLMQKRPAWFPSWQYNCGFCSTCWVRSSNTFHTLPKRNHRRLQFHREIQLLWCTCTVSGFADLMLGEWSHNCICAFIQVLFQSLWVCLICPTCLENALRTLKTCLILKDVAHCNLPDCMSWSFIISLNCSFCL